MRQKRVLLMRRSRSRLHYNFNTVVDEEVLGVIDLVGAEKRMGNFYAIKFTFRTPFICHTPENNTPPSHITDVNIFCKEVF